MSDEQTFSVTRYGSSGQLVAKEEGLTEDEAIRITRLATGLPLGGWQRGKLALLERRIIHVAPPVGYDPEAPNETIIVEVTND